MTRLSWIRFIPAHLTVLLVPRGFHMMLLLYVMVMVMVSMRIQSINFVLRPWLIIINLWLVFFSVPNLVALTLHKLWPLDWFYNTLTRRFSLLGGIPLVVSYDILLV